MWGAMWTTASMYLLARTNTASARLYGRPVLVSCKLIIEPNLPNTRIICHNIAISLLITIITIIPTRV